MTTQERINGIVERVIDIAEKANTPEEESNQIMEELAEMAYSWLEAKAAAETLMVIVGLMADRYPPNLAQSFIRECVQLAQHDELSVKKADGISYIRRAFDPETYDQLMQLFLEAARDELLSEEEKPEVELVYDPVIADEYRAEQTAKAGKGATVETVEKVPDVDTAEKKAPARKQAGVKAAARVAAAGKKTVAQTKKKATRAADGK